MNIYILRHAIAVEHGTPGFENDADRPLTDEGKRKLRRVVKAIEEMKISFDRIISSPYTRARETAEMVAHALGAADRLELTDTLIPSGSTADLVNLLNQPERAAKNVVLVGHEPYLSRFISLLLSGTSESAITLKKAGLCKLRAESLTHGRCASLEWLLTPRQMGCIA